MLTCGLRSMQCYHVVISFLAYKDYNYQDLSFRDTIAKPGDSFITQCWYDLGGRTNVKFGPGNLDEMCIDFVGYWPRDAIDNDESVCGYIANGAYDGSAVVAAVDRQFGVHVGTTTVTPPTAAPTAAPAADVTIMQTGNWDWTMVSDTDGVSNGNVAAKWPTLTFAQGSVVAFNGETLNGHHFAIKASNGSVVVGPTALADGTSETFFEAYTFATVGQYVYFCPPHSSFMNGAINVVAPVNTTGHCGSTCRNLRRGLRPF